jgi:hypothetical protein
MMRPPIAFDCDGTAQSLIYGGDGLLLCQTSGRPAPGSGG